MKAKWVVNASPLIALGNISRLDLLTDLCDELVIPSAVSDEIFAGASNDKAVSWVKDKGYIYIRKGIKVEPKIIAWDLGKGESEVISFCYTHRNFKAVLDDLAARKCASAFKVNTQGTLGIILLAKKFGLISNVREILDTLINTNFRIDEKLIGTILFLANENH